MSRLSRRAILFAGALISLPFSAYSAGLGKLTVLSNLGEPLKAEIDVVAVDKGERDSLSARLATAEAYLQANLPFPNGAWGLKIALETRPSGEAYVSISSSNPVSEPFVDMLVDLRWNGGRLLRAYTALLDPPAYSAPDAVPPATLSAPATAAATKAPEPKAAEPQALDAKATKGGAAPVMPEKSAELNAPSAQPEKTSEPMPEATAARNDVARNDAARSGAAKPAASTAAGTVSGASTATPGTRTVKRGDTLAKIAREVKPADVSLEQMLVLLYRSNPDAFAGKNMNRLKTGKILRVPEATEATGVTAEEARKEVRVQAADWNAWREKIASGVAATPAISESSQSASGAITAKVEEKPAKPAEQPKEVLKLSKGEAKGAASGKGAAGDRVQALEEEITARGKAVGEAKDRTEKLEKTIKDMQAMMEIKNKDMATAQQSAAAPKDAKHEAAPGAKDAKHEAAQAPAKPAEAPHLAPEAKPEVKAEQTAPAATTTPPAAEPAPVMPPAANSEPEKPAKPAKPKMAAKPAPEPSLMQKVLGQPMYLAGGAGLLALLGLGGFAAWRKRKAAPAGEDEADVTPQDDGPLPDEEQAAAAEMPEASVQAKQPDEHVSEEVDAVAEADVYLAYGRDGQAEQILKDALQTQPDRQEIHAKLLEIYHKRKDAGSFAPVAQALYETTGGKGEIWDKVARMGYQIDPSNALYAEGAGAGAPTEDITASGSLDNKLDLDLGLGQGGDAGTNTDIDLGDMTLNTGHADLDLSALAGSSEADLDLRTQVLDSTRQIDLGKTADANAKTQKISQMDLTAELGRTQEGKGKDSLDFDLDLSTITATSNQVRSEPGGLDLDIGNLSLDTTADGKSEPTIAGGSTLPDVDLSSISLDLESTTANATNSNGGKDEHWHDVQTKFDLAKAYQEMGDKEGAREILREVVQEGDDDQKSAAQKVLEALV